MKNKIALIFILLTPILIVALSSIYFSMGYSPEGTKNEGVFFNEYFDVTDMDVYKNEQTISFEDGKWIMVITHYYADIRLKKEIYQIQIN